MSTRAVSSTDARGDKRNVRHEFRPVGRRALRFASHATFSRRARVHTGRKWYRCAKCETRCLSRVPARRETGPPVCITCTVYPEGPCPHGPEVVPMRAEINETFVTSSGPSGDGPSGQRITRTKQVPIAVDAVDTANGWPELVLFGPWSWEGRELA